MLRKSLICICAAGLLSPSLAQSEILDDLLNINDILGSLCGQRVMVLWVDETDKTAPCIMAYSAGCVEAQTTEPQSCTQVLEALIAETELTLPHSSMSAK